MPGLERLGEWWDEDSHHVADHRSDGKEDQMGANPGGDLLALGCRSGSSMQAPSLQKEATDSISSPASPFYLDLKLPGAAQGGCEVGGVSLGKVLLLKTPQSGEGVENVLLPPDYKGLSGDMQATEALPRLVSLPWAGLFLPSSLPTKHFEAERASFGIIHPVLGTSFKRSPGAGLSY